MSTRAVHPQQGQEYGLMFIAIALMFIFLIWIYQPPIMYGCIWLIYQLWSLCDFPRIHVYVAERINLLALAGNQVNNMTWGEFIAVMNRTAGILMVPLSIIVVGSMLAIRNHPRNLTRRHIDVYTLPHIMAQFSPNIIPALCYGDKKTQLLNCDPPEHRSAQSPDEFAIQHQLVIGERLDRTRAQTVFEQQLGTPLKDFSSFNAHERALVAVFGLQVFFNDRKGAQKLLDSLNRSCLIKSRRDKGQKGYPVLRLANDAFYKVANSPVAVRWLRHYSSTRTALSALHDRDLRLPGANFRWLKGLDRTLWYALTSSGRPKVFIEGAGVIAAAKWETLIAEISEKFRVTIPVPATRMDIAIEGLLADSRRIGLVLEEREAQSESRAKEHDSEDEDEDEDDSDIVILRSSPIKSESPNSTTSIPKDDEPAVQPTKSAPRAPFRPKKR
ncbi:conjugal transfer protein TrbA (plasmid) [Yersinia ruckeri]|uniref:secretion/conjugation apparatus DotM-related subunit n=1 Tax=Yersinia ruckeri TaxID=29486 RepID=UPI0022372C20|nr:conjugal transfer protein TrbA [Yersinia ruckeri]MCW6572802.1 conjugal transfer protein TrbA [Yersinia ruckeri]UZX67048.1 conjugal transfer protein TrbA [Yersinia ruckeri]